MCGAGQEERCWRRKDLDATGNLFGTAPQRGNYLPQKRGTKIFADGGYETALWIDIGKQLLGKMLMLAEDFLDFAGPMLLAAIHCERLLLCSSFH